MSTEEQSAAVPETLAPGAALAAARDAAQLSVAEVARHLRLSVAQVEALEAGDFERLPGPVFVRGFIRNYARLVKLDPDVLLPQVEPDLAGLPHSPETPPSKNIPFPPQRPSRWPLLGLLILVALAGLVFYEFYWTEQRSARDVPPVAVPPVAVPPAPAAPVAVRPEPPAAPETTAVSAPVVTAAPLPSPVGDTPKIQEPAAGSPPPAVAQPVAVAVPDGGAVHLVFSEESWVEIQDRDGKVVLSQLNPPGSEKRVSGRAPLSIVIGNAHAVRLTYNGRPVDLAPHTKVDVARFVLE